MDELKRIYYQVVTNLFTWMKVNKIHNPVVFMFSGQGSQYYHMGKELYHHNPTFKRWLLHLNDLVYQKTGLSIIAEIYNENKSIADKFDQLSYTHPAIFMVEYALACVFIESGLEPDYLLGASLGEFTMAALAGILSVEDVLDCILKQVELVTNCCHNGSMIAIMHNPELYHQSPEINLHSELAAVNYASHFVISGAREELFPIENYLKSRNILFQTLPVHYGFHSANIAPIEQEYQRFLSRFTFKKPEIPIISCLTGNHTGEIPPGYFWRIVRKPILFQKAIMELEKNGPLHYIDLGPFSTLAGFAQKNQASGLRSQYYAIMTPFHQDLKNIQTIEKSVI